MYQKLLLDVSPSPASHSDRGFLAGLHPTHDSVLCSPSVLVRAQERHVLLVLAMASLAFLASVSKPATQAHLEGL